jgi:hypothetical protein
MRIAQCAHTFALINTTLRKYGTASMHLSADASAVALVMAVPRIITSLKCLTACTSTSNSSQTSFCFMHTTFDWKLSCV